MTKSFEQLMNEGLERKLGLLNESLDEALPKDLIKNMKWTRLGAEGEDAYSQAYDAERVDYEASDYEEISADTVLNMKKNGEPLDNIYIMKDGKLLGLDAVGHPVKERSTIDARYNQALKKSLAGADKIYKVTALKRGETHPDRFADSEERAANRNLGANHLPSWQARKGSDYNDSKARAVKAVKQAKLDYENGDISRKEYEARIERAKEISPSKRSIQNYNRIRNANARNRNFASEKNLQKPFNDLQDARRELSQAKDNLADSQKELEKIQSDDTTGYKSYGSYNRAIQEIPKIKEKIASLQAELKRYEDLVNSGAKERDIEKAQASIDQHQAEIDAAQDKVDTILRRK